MRAKSRKKLIRTAVIIAAVLVVLLVLFAIFSGGTMSFSALKRRLTYMGSEKTDGGMYGEINFVNHTGSSIRSYMDGIIIASRTGVEVLDKNGEEVMLASASMASPEVTVEDKRAFAYDVGGTAYVVIDEGKIALDKESDNAIITASMNTEGDIALVTKQSSYKASVFVINSENEQVLQQNISSGYVSAACTAPDGDSVAVALMSYENGDFTTKIVSYPVGGGGTEEFVIKDEMVIALHYFSSGRLCAVTENGVHFISRGLDSEEKFSFGSSYLKDFTFDSENRCVLFLREYESGNEGRVVVLSDTGSVEGDGNVSGEVLCISAGGDYVAALYYDGLEIYRYNMDLYASTEETGSAIDVIMRSDGSVMLISYGTAKIYLP